MPKFSSGHYNEIAKVVGELQPAFDHSYWSLAETSYREEVCMTFIELFEKDNPNFNRDKFADACDIDPNSIIRNKGVVQIMGIYVTTEVAECSA